MASAKLDNLFGRSNSWENYAHGLGDLGNFVSRSLSNYDERESKKARVKRR
jgi:hypothetical protein